MFDTLNVNGANGANGASQDATTLVVLGGGIPRPIGVSPWPTRDGDKVRWQGLMRINSKPADTGLTNYIEPAKDIAPPPRVDKFMGWTIENRAIAAISQMAALVPDNWKSSAIQAIGKLTNCRSSAN